MIEDEMARLAATYPKEPLPKIEKGPMGNWNQPSMTVSHAFMPPRTSAKVIEREFEIELPADFKEFYSRWNEGLLLVRNPVKIMSPDCIVTDTLEIRDVQETPRDTPFRTIRFGELAPNFHFVLRFSPSAAAWVVDLWASSEQLYTEFQSPECDTNPTDSSFTEWLQRMIMTDGAPLHPAYPDNEDDYFNQRVA